MSEEQKDSSIEAVLRDQLGMHLNAARVSEVEFVYCVGQGQGESPTNWYVGADETGFRFAGHFPWLRGHVPGPKAMQTALREIAEGPETDAGTIWEIARDTVLAPPGEPPLMECIRAAFGVDDEEIPDDGDRVEGVEFEEEWDAEISRWVSDLTRPMRQRIGPRRIALWAWLDEAGEQMAKLDDDFDAKARRSIPTWVVRSDPDSLKRALRAAETHHWMAWAVATLWETEFPDDERAVVDKVLEKLAIPAPVRKRMGRWCGKLDADTVRLLRVLPIDHVPKAGDEGQWAALSTVARVLGSSGVSQRRFPSLIAASKGRWADYVARLGAKFVPNVVDNEAWIELGTTIRDLVDAFRNAIPPTIARPNDHEFTPSRADRRWMAEEAVVGDRGLATILESVEEWHDSYETSPRLTIEWEPVLPEWTAPKSGISVHVLGSWQELHEEGRKGDGGLDHCVGSGGYAKACWEGGTRIVSLRRDGLRLSTAEIDLPRGQVVQHLARKNTRPGDDQRAALRSYMRLHATRAHFGHILPEGYPVEEKDRTVSFEETLGTWRPYLSGSWKTAGPMDFVRAMRTNRIDTILEGEPAARRYG